MPNKIVSIVGRPNVGKSTLFNRLLGQKKAIVSDSPGTTRDRNYAECSWAGQNFTLIDTGGFDPCPKDKLKALVMEQTQIAIEESNAIIFLLDGKEGINPVDREISKLLRKSHKKVIYVVNKIDNFKEEAQALSFYELGIDKLFMVSSLHGLGISDFLDEIIKTISPDQEKKYGVKKNTIKIAVLGRPNVGKSSIINSILGEQRFLVSEVPGTTVDSLDIVLKINGQEYLFIDTAGIRKKSRVKTTLEKGSISYSLKSLKKCSIALLVIDAFEGLTDQDLKIANLIHREGKGFILVANKWDLIRDTGHIGSSDRPLHILPQQQNWLERKQMISEKWYSQFVKNRLGHIDYANIIFTSAKTGLGVKNILPIILKTHKELIKKIPTGDLNANLSSWILKHHPPMYQGREVRLKYAQQIRIEPPTFQIFANYPKGIPISYTRYLEKKIREKFGFKGVPIRIGFRK